MKRKHKGIDKTLSYEQILLLEECLLNGDEMESALVKIGVSKKNILWKIAGFVAKELLMKLQHREKKTKTYTHNQHSFSDGNTPDVAYWVGFMLSDGYIYKDQVSMKLQLNDIEQVMRFRDFIGSNHHVEIFYNNVNGEKLPYCSLRITSRQMKKDLERYGVVPRKSLILTFPDEEAIPKSCRYDLLRGYMDGDGCIYTNLEQNIITVSYVGTKVFIQQTLDIFGLPENKIQPSGNAFTYSFSSKETVRDFLRNLYKQATTHTYMERKYQKAASFFGQEFLSKKI